MNNKQYNIFVADIYFLEFENNQHPIYIEYLNLKNEDAEKCMKPLVDFIEYKGCSDSLKIPAVLFGPYSSMD